MNVVESSEESAGWINRPAAADLDLEEPLIAESGILGLRAATLTRILLPVFMGFLLLAIWEITVDTAGVPSYVVPGPLLIAKTMVKDWDLLFSSLLSTLDVAGLALAIALIMGVSIAIIFNHSKWVEMTFFPYAVIMQVTPLAAVAPLIILWVDNIHTGLLICAWIVPFFPILSTTTTGLNSADHNLVHLFQIYHASRWQTLIRLKIPSAMPFFLAGLRISGGLCLVGAVVAEFVAGAGGKGAGLAYLILESGYDLKTPRMFAALIMISVCGVAVFLLTSAISYLCLHRWHESSIRKES
jgi:NitT/TauT family transport system permease protein